jgi:lysine-specific demethylase 8
MRVLADIERRTAIDRAEFEREFALRNQPVVISGAIEHWPALERWKAPALRARLGGLQTRFKVAREHRHPDFSAASSAEMFRTEGGTFNDFFDGLASEPSEARRYLLTGEEQWLFKRRPGQVDQFTDSLRELFADFYTPNLFDDRRLYSSWFWLSAAGVRTWLHYDNNDCHNLNAQVQGSKRVWLISPDQLSRLYPFGVDAAVPAYNCSQVDAESPDLERFPSFAEVEALSGEINAGDLLFIPANWSHTFVHTGPFNANVNFWWKPEALIQSVTSVRQGFFDALATAGGAAQLAPAERALLASLERALLARA